MKKEFKTESGETLIVQIDDSPSCEHCDDSYFGITLQTGEDECCWCIDCMNCEVEFTDAEYDQLYAWQREEEIKWHKERIKELTKK